MAKYTKACIVLNLVVGVVWLLVGIRDAWAPRFLSISSARPNGNPWFDFVVATLFLAVACAYFMRMRRASAK